MRKRRTADPLPPEWLPAPSAPLADGDEVEWESRLQRLMSAAEPALAELARTSERSMAAGRAPAGAPWWTVLAARWRPALAGAALAAAAVVVTARIAPGPAVSAESPASAFALTTIAGEGDAAALWNGLGVPADPVLAELVLQGGSQ